MSAEQRDSLHGRFSADLQRWLEIWDGNPETPATLSRQMRLIWTQQPLRAAALMRFGTWCTTKHIPLLPGISRRLNITLHGLDVVTGTPIGDGFYLPHTVGTVVMAQRIGRNVTLVSNVTIGMRRGDGFPTIGNDVYIGAGARILGPVTIGDGASIGANAVVLQDVPAGATAVGVPARILARKDRESAQNDRDDLLR